MFMLLGLMGAVLVGSAVMLQTDVLEDEDIPEEDDSGGDDYGNMFDQIPTDDDGFDLTDSTEGDNTDAAPFDDFLGDDSDDTATDDAAEDATRAASADFDRLYGDDPDDDFLADFLADDLDDDVGQGLDFLDDTAEDPADDDDDTTGDDTIAVLAAAEAAPETGDDTLAADMDDDASTDDGADVIWLDNADLAAGSDPFFDLDDWLDDENETEITGYNPEQDKIVVIWDDSDDGEVPELRIEPVEGTDDVQLVVGGTAVSTVIVAQGLPPTMSIWCPKAWRKPDRALLPLQHPPRLRRTRSGCGSRLARACRKSVRPDRAQTPRPSPHPRPANRA